MPRLDILLARNLDLSRREVTRLLKRGAVRDEGGAKLEDGKVQLAPDTLPRVIEVSGERVLLYTRFELLQHKPIGVVTALRDATHPTALDVLPSVPLRSELRAVGRLDKDTSGLLLWTTDGALLHRMTHPRYAVPRTYDVALLRPYEAPPPDLRLDDGYAPRIVALETLPEEAMHPGLQPTEEAAVWARITIASGRFHEVRRIFAALGSHVVGLCRIAYGSLRLPEDLPPSGILPVDLRAAFGGMHPEPLSESGE